MHLILIGANALLYVAAVAVSGGVETGGRLLGLGAVDPKVLLRFGAANHHLVTAGAEWWRLVCPIFLHASLIHLLFNCVAIRWAGGVAEHALGPAKFLALYLLCGLAGSAVSLAWHGSSLGCGVGASGAAFGAIGMSAVYALRTRNDALWRWMSQWAILALVLGMTPGIDNAAHLGGLAAGAGLGYVSRFAERTRLSPRAVRLWDAAGATAVLLVAVSFAIAFA
jgi:rhomboid protease GluP